MKWTITKCYSRGNVGATVLPSDYNFCEVGAKVGPKTLWDKLCEVDGGWEFYKDEDAYVFENNHIDKDGNSWGRSEIVLTYTGYRTVYDDLKEWLERGKEFVVYCDDSEVDIGDEGDILNADEIMEAVENFIACNVPEEALEVVVQGIEVGIEGELICNNPYASPECSLEWTWDKDSFTITVETFAEICAGYVPFTFTLTIEKAD